jgi:amidase
MPADNLVFMTATEVAAAIRARRVTCVEVLDALLAQIAAHNPGLNAIVTLDKDAAFRRAEEADAALTRGEWWGLLHGVPITVKDFFEVAGVRSTCSYPPLADHVPDADATCVARLRAAGAIILGKTNLPPLASDWQTNSPLFGRTNNPWDLARTPGGSTGGGAAAVAAGLSYLELGSDLGGSIRVPAHFCGIAGAIATDDWAPKAGSLPRQAPGGTFGRLLRIGGLARAVADLQLFLSLVTGPDPAEPAIPPLPWIEPPPQALAGLRVAWCAEVDGVPVSADTRRAVTDVARLLTDLGCSVELCAPPGLQAAQARDLWLEYFMTMIGAQMPTAQRLLGRYLGHVKPFDLDLKRYLLAETRRAALMAVLDRFFLDWDVWLCPVASIPAFRHMAPTRTMGLTSLYEEPLPLDGGTIEYMKALSSFTIPINIAGNPAVVLPAGRSAEGLPIGVQLIGRRWHDAELLARAALIEAALGPFPHPPGY